MEDLCLEWSQLTGIPKDKIIPNETNANDPTVRFYLIDPEEIIDFLIEPITRDDYLDWMPCRVRTIPPNLVRCRYININVSSPVHNRTLYMNIYTKNGNITGTLQEFDGDVEVSCEKAF